MTEYATKARLPYDPPGFPLNVRILEVDKDSIMVGWDAPEYDGGTPIIQYLIEKSDVTKNPMAAWVLAGRVQSNINDFRVTRLFTGNSYKFRVLAENRVGVSEPSTIDKPVTAKL